VGKIGQVRRATKKGLLEGMTRTHSALQADVAIAMEVAEDGQERCEPGGCAAAAVAMKENKGLSMEPLRKQAEVARLNGVNPTREEEEVGYFAMERYKIILSRKK
jgi:hypothetical protein